jgi:hypothetical protein
MLKQSNQPLQILYCNVPESATTSTVKAFAIEQVLTHKPLKEAWNTPQGLSVLAEVAANQDKQALIQLAELGYVPDTFSHFKFLLTHPEITAILIQHSAEIAEQLAFQLSIRAPEHYPMIEAIMHRQNSIAIGQAVLQEFSRWKLEKYPWNR